MWLRHCNSTGTAYFYPRDISPFSFSRDTSWIKGTIYTFAIVHRGPTPPFRDRTPYVPIIVELEEGARMPSNLVECDPDPEKIKVGMAVEVVFQAISDEITIPYFRPASGCRLRAKSR